MQKNEMVQNLGLQNRSKTSTFSESETLSQSETLFSSKKVFQFGPYHQIVTVIFSKKKPYRFEEFSNLVVFLVDNFLKIAKKKSINVRVSWYGLIFCLVI